MKKLKIKLVDWEYECGDGCCYDSGQDIHLNGKQLNENHAENNENALIAVLTELGYEVEIENKIEDE
jgi:hypothetical protein